MKHIILASILVMTSLSFSCTIGQTSWCVDTLYNCGVNASECRQYGIDPNGIWKINYGGPELKIRAMLNDPCNGTRITTVSKFPTSNDHTYVIECADIGYELHIAYGKIEYINNRFLEHVQRGNGHTLQTNQFAVNQALQRLSKFTSTVETNTSTDGPFWWHP